MSSMYIAFTSIQFMGDIFHKKDRFEHTEHIKFQIDFRPFLHSKNEFTNKDTLRITDDNGRHQTQL